MKISTLRTAVVVLGLAIGGCAIAQISFQRTYQRPDAQCTFWGACNTLDGGFAFAGSDNDAGGNIIIMKVDGTGEAVFSRSYEPSQFDFAYAIAQTADSGFVVTGQGYNMGLGGAELYLMRTDKNGLLLWRGVYGTNQLETGLDVINTPDGGVLAVGYENFHGYFVKTDDEGTLLWNATIADLPITQVHAIASSPGGGYVFTGTTRSTTQGAPSLLLGQIDDEGQLGWKKRYSLTTGVAGSDIAVAQDGGYWITGTATRSSGNCAIVLRTDASGQLIWSRVIGINDFGATGEEASGIIATQDGGCLVAGTTNAYSTASDAMFIKLTAEGDIEWGMRYGNFFDEYAAGVLQAVDGGFAIYGTQDAGSTYAFLNRTDMQGTSGCNEAAITADLDVFNETLTVSETPAAQGTYGTSLVTTGVIEPYEAVISTPCLTTSVDDHPSGGSTLPFDLILSRHHLQLVGTASASSLSASILDATGRIVKDQQNTGGRMVVDLSGFKPGVYLVLIRYMNEVWTERIMLNEWIK